MNDDLISRSALIAEYCDGCDYPAKGLCDNDVCGFALMIKEAPAIDAVEVVRCKNCEAWQTKNAMSFLRDGVHVRCCPCGVLGRLMYDDDFCSRGKTEG